MIGQPSFDTKPPATSTFSSGKNTLDVAVGVRVARLAVVDGAAAERHAARDRRTSSSAARLSATADISCRTSAPKLRCRARASCFRARRSRTPRSPSAAFAPVCSSCQCVLNSARDRLAGIDAARRLAAARPPTRRGRRRRGRRRRRCRRRRRFASGPSRPSSRPTGERFAPAPSARATSERAPDTTLTRLQRRPSGTAGGLCSASTPRY